MTIVRDTHILTRPGDRNPGFPRSALEQQHQHRGNHLSRCVRRRQFWSPLLLCFMLNGCGGSFPDSTSTSGDESANPQPGSSAHIELPAPPTMPVDSAPSEILSNRRHRPPKYPVQAIREGKQGKTVLRVLVGVDGEPEEIILEESSGSEDLDRSAIAAVGTWTFNAGMKNGIAVRGHLLVPVEFNLNQ